MANVPSESALHIFRADRHAAREEEARPQPADYWRIREQAARKAAKTSSSGRARAAHQELAQMYASKKAAAPQ